MKKIRMLNFLKSKKKLTWCFFDFGISSYPTIILTFFYGAYYAKNIAPNETIGASNWGFSISVASFLSFLLISFLFLEAKKYVKEIGINFFCFFFYLKIFSCLLLFFFNENSNAYYPLVLIIISFICFEFLNILYNSSLHKLSKKNLGFLSNIGWAFGYLGGLLSLLLMFNLIKLTEKNSFEFLSFSIFQIIGPFVGIWTLIFGSLFLYHSSSIKFKTPNVVKLYQNIQSMHLSKFLTSYFFFNNGIICIFAYASIFASFLFEFNEMEILYLGIFINLLGIIGCLIFGLIEKKMSSKKTIIICILGLLVLTISLFFSSDKLHFWIIALFIGFFVGPIQASSRAYLSLYIKSDNQMATFSLYSIIGNICAILGPFLVGLIIKYTDSLQVGLLVISLFFFLSLFPFVKELMFKMSYARKK